MPSESFLKLDDDKRKKIIQAMKKEFGRAPLNKTSVDKIVEDAGISKGSFWVYFENKDEAIDYIISIYMEEERKKVLVYLKDNKGDIFKTAYNMYEYLVENDNTKLLMGNIMQNLILNRDKELIFPRENCKNNFKELIDLLDVSYFKSKEEVYIKTVIKMINQATRTNALDTILGKFTKEISTKNLKRELEIIKYGVQTEQHNN